jgi:methionine-rich copper-binding protein CopC
VKRSLIPLIAAVAASLTTWPAQAHASLLSSKPGPGEVVPSPLTEITLEFDDQITDQSQIQLIGEDFAQVPTSTQSVEGAVLTAHFDRALSPGNYTVAWTAATPDSHTTSGSYQFSVEGKPGAPSVWVVVAVPAAVVLALVLGLLGWRRRNE